MIWQPIETAPKDGTEVLLFDPNCEPKILIASYAVRERLRNGKVIARYEQWEWPMILYSGRPNPTHWMPLPQEPD